MAILKTALIFSKSQSGNTDSKSLEIERDAPSSMINTKFPMLSNWKETESFLCSHRLSAYDVSTKKAYHANKCVPSWLQLQCE